MNLLSIAKVSAERGKIKTQRELEVEVDGTIASKRMRIVAAAGSTLAVMLLVLSVVFGVWPS